MTILSNEAKNILRLLVDHLPKVQAGKPQTYVTYKEVHDKLSLELRGTYGTSLQYQGLDDLADWTMAEGHPAITGLITKHEDYEPGTGYFKLLGSPEYYYDVWEKHIKLSKNYDWQPFLETELRLQKDSIANDIGVPPERIKHEINRIIRDTALAQKVKKLYNYQCQICGDFIEIPDNKRYAEAHHIKPLGKAHNGPDTEDNIICLCPNHHAAVDYGAIKIHNLKLNEHALNTEYIEYHNQEIYRKP